MGPVLADDYIQKIILLERSLGAKVGYGLLDPFHLDTTDIVAVQSAARKIAEFVGLVGHTFIVSVARQDDGIGGHVELKRWEKEVFVELSPNTASFQGATLAVLAHEISHKYL
ncbi:MAG: hypothetical protein QF662_00960, partial [Phycisphaerae bacterium]|nr:hypothetical protein [Phycisphaerae bacterium]